MPKVVHGPMTALFPVPVVLVSCGVERPNIITLAWVGTVCSEPPMVGIAVRPTRFSHGLIKAAGQFVVNLPTTALLKAVEVCGTVSGWDREKFALAGLTPAPPAKIEVPLIAECPLNIECLVRQTILLGSHDLFLGEVVAVQSDQALLNQHAQVDFQRAEWLCYLAGAYHSLSRRLGSGS